MKEKLRIFFDGKSVLILGYGREGQSTLELIKDFNCTIAISDKNLKITEEIKPYRLYGGEGYLDCIGDYDVIMKSPGIALFDSVSEETKKKITSQTDLFLRFCNNKIIGITGTKGKSTTSSLIYHILKECGIHTHLVGNIGIPPLAKIDEFEDDSVIVCEMSCHQLEYVNASPDVAVLLNIYEEHLDHYVDFYAYKTAKENIYRYLDKDGLLVYNLRCYNAEIEKLKARAIPCSMYGSGEVFIEDDIMNICDIKIPLDKIKTKLAGEHNLYNIAVALCVCISSGCNPPDAIKSVESFEGLEHRLEHFATIDGVKFVNDSISTIPMAAISAIKAFPEADTLIIGGMDRGISYDVLIGYLNEGTVKNIICLKDSGYKIAPELDGNVLNVFRARDMEEAVAKALEITKKCCILSPAAASYGFYKNFEERGTHFKELVKKLSR